MRPTTALRQLLKGDGIVLAPGVYDGLSARLVRAAGFAAAYATGGGIARSMGYPDLGLLSMREVTDRLALIVEHAGVPVTADADTGYGNALDVRRTVREFERAGVAALHLEDQAFPKRCGHYDDKALISTAEMSQKLRALDDPLSRGQDRRRSRIRAGRSRLQGGLRGRRLADAEVFQAVLDTHRMRPHDANWR